MKRIAAVLTFSFLLAACGGQTGTTPPTETPPVEQPPVEQPPTTPPPNPIPPTQPPPTENVPYYGEWAWSFTPGDGCCNEEGRFSIVQVRDFDPPGSGFGFYQDCYEGACYDSLEGGVIMGPGEDNTLTITLFKVDSAGDFVPVYEAVDADGELTPDERGRLVFEGRATYYESYTNDTARGNFRAVLTDFPVAFPPFE